MLSTFSNTAGTASVLGNQTYGPYGNQQYKKGSLGTSKGFTGQYNDATGLDYYNARYYDPIVGRFLSADIKEGNTKGVDPYTYVNGNPETKNDPTGEAGVDPSDPYVQYVGAWYQEIHPLSYVWTNEVAIPNSATPSGNYNTWSQFYNQGTPGSYGRPDIVSLSYTTAAFTVWEVKTGGGLNLKNMGWSDPADSTILKGNAQAIWYAKRANIERNRWWWFGLLGARWTTSGFRISSDDRDMEQGDTCICDDLSCSC